MPPKRSRATSSKSRETHPSVVSVSIQTENYHNEEILNYKNQIILLQNELQECRKIISALQSENTFLKNQNNKKVKDSLRDNLIEKNTLKIRNEKISSPRSGTKVAKGCSCKGNCSNKICGCVKKGTLCQEFCRCNDAQCKNQEPEKENFDQDLLSKDGQKALEKLGRLTLNQEILHASEKKAKRLTFSPFGDRNGILNASKSYPASPLALETRRRLFTQDSEDLVDIDTNTNEEDALPTEPKFLDTEENINDIGKSQIPFPHTQAAKCTRRLKITEKNLKTTNNINLTINPPSILITESRENEEDNLLSEAHKKIIHSPQVLRRKSKSISPDAHVNRRKYTENKRMAKVKCKSVSPKKPLNCKFDKIENSPQSSSNEVGSVSNQNKIENNLNIPSMKTYLKTLLSPQESCNKSFVSLQSNASESSSNSNNEILDISLNPMVPKRELPRSPINTSGAIIIPADNKRFSPPKKELAVVEVDWEQHQSELVMCKICKRKFFPHRIEKHVSSCKGI